MNGDGVLREWYDDGALVMNDEAVVLLGHLVGLNCIDANLCMKGDDLDNQVCYKRRAGVDSSSIWKEQHRSNDSIR